MASGGQDHSLSGMQRHAVPDALIALKHRKSKGTIGETLFEDLCGLALNPEYHIVV